MRLTKFRWNQSTDSVEKTYEGFNHIRAWRSSCSCGPDAAKILLFYLPNDALIRQAVLDKIFEQY